MNVTNNFTIRSPQSDLDFQRYYQLRWKILREPWGQPKGSEKVPEENEFYHIMAEQDDDICGVGCIRFITDDTAQIRFMGVAPTYQNQGVGKAILTELEQYAAENNCKKIKLFAREIAVPFYLNSGYTIIGDGYTLFETIHHKVMEKALH